MILSSELSSTTSLPAITENEEIYHGHSRKNVCESAPEEEVLARKETRAVNVLRLVAVSVLVVVTLTVSLLAYFYGRSTQMASFQNEYGHNAEKIVDEFQANAGRRLTALRNFADSITSHADSTDEVMPMVTLPNFERRAAYTLQLAQVISILMYPVVSDKDRETWEAYSVANQGWLTEGLLLQSQVSDTNDQDVIDFINDQDQENQAEQASGIDGTEEIPSFIFNLNQDSETSRSPAPGPYTPLWQVAPAIPVPGLINFNGLSHPHRMRQLAAVIERPRTIISAATDFSIKDDPDASGRKAILNLFLNRIGNGNIEYEDGPVSDIYIPVFDGYGENRTLGSILTSYVYWQGYFSDILAENSIVTGVICVLANSCGQEFTFRIEGAVASYEGQGDLHDPVFDDMMVETGYGAVVGSENVDWTQDGQCYYNVRVYPSRETQGVFMSNEPIAFCLTLIGVFLFTSMVFVLYDCLQQRRHHVVNDRAQKSTAVVASLFPESVLSRMSFIYKKSPNKPISAKEKSRNRAYLADAAEEISSNFFADHAADLPIADLYSECTVLFADIAGFTKWSSTREPSLVFYLLETLYGVFDGEALKHHVFKIETIGDCYVAVTGLPNPQPDHAVIMCDMAAACASKMKQLLPKLAGRLGEDTAELSMRFGIHSGQVTAGVLRGERPRFQLFGDTVNTASRMESNGQKGRIHASEATAELLFSAGKHSWVTRRDDLVEAKGKGSLQTYWVTPPALVAAFENERSYTKESPNDSRETMAGFKTLMTEFQTKEPSSSDLQITTGPKLALSKNGSRSCGEASNSLPRFFM